MVHEIASVILVFFLGALAGFALNCCISITKAQKYCDRLFRAFMDPLSLESVDEYCESKRISQPVRTAIMEFVSHVLEEARKGI